MANPVKGGAPRAVSTDAIRTAALCRITVQGGTKRVDVSLPAGVPLLELTPALAELCGAAPAEAVTGAASAAVEGTPPAWTLARAGGDALDLTASLDAAGIRDGEVLHLVDATRWRTPIVRDLIEAVADVIESGGRRWTWADVSWVLAGAAILWVAAAGVVLIAAPGASGAAATAAAGALLLASAVTMAAATLLVRHGRAARSAWAVTSWVLAAAGGWATAGIWADDPGQRAIAAAVAGAVAVLASYPILPSIVPGVALLLVAAGAGAAATATGRSPAAVAAVIGVVAVIGVRIAPAALTNWLASLLTAATVRDTEAGVQRVRAAVASISAALCALATAAGAVLIVAGGRFQIGLAGLIALALALRACTFRFLIEGLPPAAGAGLLLLALEYSAARHLWGSSLVVPAVLLVTGVLLAALLAAPGLPAPRTSVVRLLWMAVDILLLPLALGAIGAFDAIAAAITHVHLPSSR